MACVAVLAVLAFDVAVLGAMFRRPFGLFTAARGLWLSASGLALGLVGAWLYARLGMCYQLDRNKLVIRCLTTRHTIPLPTVSDVLPVDARTDLADFAGIRGLGLLIGWATVGGLGPARCCALGWDAKLVCLVTSHGDYIISPRDAEGFVAACLERRRLGPTRAVAPATAGLLLPRDSFLSDVGAMTLLFGGFWLNTLLFVHVALHQEQGGGLGTDPIQAMQWPLIGLTSWALDSLLGVLVQSRQRLLGHVLLATPLLVGGLLWRVASVALPAAAGAVFLYQVATGFCLSAIIAALAYQKEALSASGALGALALGTVTFGFGGWVWGGLLIAFFASSSALSRYRRREKERLSPKFAKGSRRDMGQVLANGGLGAAAALASYFLPGSGWPIFFLGVMSAVNADTWATEVGVLSKRLPRLITSWRRVAVGTSGGISPLGLAASASGGLFMGLVALFFTGVDALVRHLPVPDSLLWLPILALAGGLVGSLADSLLGATLQGIYWCAACDAETERPVHACGQPTRLIRGWAWLDNDRVNFISSLVGGLAALALWALVL